MKKSVVAFSALAMAAVMCAGFTACGSKSEAEKLVSDVVTKEQWEAMYTEEHFSNCKSVYREIGSAKFDDVALGELEDFIESGNGGFIGSDGLITDASQLSSWGKNTTTYTYIKDGEKSYYKTEFVSESEHNSHAMDSKVECYWVDGTKYTVTKDGTSEETYTDAVPSLPGIFFVPELENSYDNFEYSKEAKGYVLKEGSTFNFYEVELNNPIVKFKDGKLAAVLSFFEEKTEHTSQSKRIEYVFTYGGQSVKAPK